MKRDKLLLLPLAIATVASSRPLDNAWLKGVTDKNPLSYQPSEPITFTVTPMDIDGEIPPGQYTLNWKLSDDYNIKRDSEKAKLLMRSYARHQGAQVSLAKILSDLQTNTGETMSEKTIDSYLEALRKIFVVEDMRSWNPNLRSRTAIRNADTRYFIDSSIAVAALGAGPDDLVADLETFGLLFETMAVRDLRVYADAMHGSVYHYRDKDGLECDAVIHLRDGRYGLVEIKLGGDEHIEAGARSLLRLKNKIDTDKMNEPSFMMVLTGMSPYALQRPDGVWVAPITSLRD